MFCKTYKCAVLVGGVLALAGFFDDQSASADGNKGDKDKSAPSGAWVRKESELKIEFYGEGEMKIAPHGDNKNVAIVCNSTVEKVGRIKVKVTAFEGVGEKLKEKIPVGVEFSFKWTVQDSTAKLDDLKGEGDILERLKSHLEGAYEKK